MSYFMMNVRGFEKNLYSIEIRRCRKNVRTSKNMQHTHDGGGGEKKKYGKRMSQKEKEEEWNVIGKYMICA